LIAFAFGRGSEGATGEAEKQGGARMKLAAIERIILVQILQAKTRGSYAIFKQIDDLAREVSFSDEEVKALGIEIKDGQVTLPFKSFAHAKEITINRTMEKLIRETLSEMDKKEQLPRNALTLYEKFFPVEAPPEGRPPEVAEKK